MMAASPAIASCEYLNSLCQFSFGWSFHIAISSISSFVYSSKQLFSIYWPSVFCCWVFLMLCYVGVHCGIYKNSYNILNISYLNYLLPHSPFSPSSPIPEIVSTDLIFPFTYMCTQYLHYIHSPHLLPYCTDTNPPPKEPIYFLFSNL
jgi:hypothetical protein